MTTHTHVFEVHYVNRYAGICTTIVDANDADRAEAAILTSRRNVEVLDTIDVTGHSGLQPLIWDD